MKYKFIANLSAITVSSILLCGCVAGIPKGALSLSPQTLEWRKLQSKRFETKDEKKILQACAALLQDLGFSLEESETSLGVIVASKDRSAVEGGQVVAAVFLAALAGGLGGTSGSVTYDQNQKFRASIVTRPFGENEDQIVVRVTFQRRVWNNRGQITKLQRINDPKMYQEFFAKLSKSIFLTANEI